MAVCDIDPAKAEAETTRRNPKVKAEDTATVLLRHVPDAVSAVDFTMRAASSPTRFPETLLEIEGSNGGIVVEAGKTRDEDICAELLPWTSRPWHVAQESVLATCRHMLECFRAGRLAETSAADNLKTFALVEAAYESAATGKAVAPNGEA